MNTPLYLYLMIGSLIGPLARSFEPRIRFASRWKALVPALLITSLYFLIWDSAFVRGQVWGFNSQYLVGFDWMGIPVEEAAFFWIIPYACIFLYETTRLHLSGDYLASIARPLSFGLAAVLLIVGLAAWPRAYTCATFLQSALLLAWLAWRRVPYLGWFWAGYFVSLLPFFLVNGILTGLLLPSPIVWYNNDETLGIRLATIPLEDSVYLLLLLLSNIALYEYFLSRFGFHRATKSRVSSAVLTP